MAFSVRLNWRANPCGDRCGGTRHSRRGLPGRDASRIKRPNRKGCATEAAQSATQMSRRERASFRPTPMPRRSMAAIVAAADIAWALCVADDNGRKPCFAGSKPSSDARARNCAVAISKRAGHVVRKRDARPKRQSRSGIIVARCPHPHRQHATTRSFSARSFRFEEGCERFGGGPSGRQGTGNSATTNLPLAARARVGHIGLTGDVAEWLKAAVC